MSLKAKDVSKLTKEEAIKKRDELARGYLELDPMSQKKKSVRKSLARLHTHIHKLAGKVAEVVAPAGKPKAPAAKATTKAKPPSQTR